MNEADCINERTAENASEIETMHVEIPDSEFYVYFVEVFKQQFYSAAGIYPRVD